MRLEHYPVEKLKKEILAIVGQHLDPSKYRVFFFGSRVEGTSDEHSDIDIGIEGPEPISPETWLDLQEEIERISTLYKIELVDFRRTVPIFQEVARQNIELIG